MNFYQMNSEKVAQMLHSDCSNGKILEDISIKRKGKSRFRSFWVNMKKETKALFSFLDLLPLVCYLLALFFSILNRQQNVLYLTIFSLVLTLILYFSVVALLCNYRRRFQNRLDRGVQLVSVIRSGDVYEIPASDLEVGDLILLKKGTMLHGDARIITEEDLYMNEQLVFSVSIPIRKAADVLEEGNLAPDAQSNMLWKGSFVTKGSGSAIITALDEDCYIEKTGGRKGIRQKSWFYNKQKSIGHLGSYVYVIFLSVMMLLALIFTARFTDAILMMGALSSVVMLNPFLLITEWNYYRTAESLYQKGAHIRNIEAFDGMNRERVLYYSSDELLKNSLSFASIEPISADERGCLTYLSLCLGDHPMAEYIRPTLKQYKIDSSALQREFPNYRCECDVNGNVVSVFAGEDHSVIVGAGYWETMLPFIGAVDDELLTRLNQLEQGGRMVWLLCSKGVSSIPNQLSAEELNGSLTPMGLITFQISKNAEIAEKIGELQHAKMKVYLVNHYHAELGQSLASTYEMDGCYAAPPEDPCYTLPHLKENPFVVFDDVSPIKKERAKLVLFGDISAQDVIYQVKCMFCGIKRSIGFLSCFCAMLIITSFVFFLREFSLEKLIVPIVLLKPALICLFYYLVETVGNCNQYKRSLLLGAICGMLGCISVIVGLDNALLSMLLSTVLLSIVFLFNVRTMRVIRRKDVAILLIAILAVLIPWFFLGGNWIAAILLSFIPAIFSYIINLFY